jgi:predicted lipid-binding transport protein (Tim44 family)
LSAQDVFDPSLIVLVALAVFVVWKLHSILGVKVDRETPAADRFSPIGLRKGPPSLPGAAPDAPIKAAPSATAPDRWQGLAEPGSQGWLGLDAIAAADRAFSGTAFLDGARKAYEMIIGAFAAGDRDTLRRLLSKEVFDNFSAEIDKREARGETLESAIVSIDSTSVDDARATPNTIQITVRFKTQLVTVRRNAAGEVIEGNLEHAAPVIDLWTFARDPRTNDPNWKLISTEAVH